MVHYGSRAIACRPDVHRDDRRVGSGAHLARLHRITTTPRKRPGSASSISSRQFRHQFLPAARPCRPQGLDTADVGRIDEPLPDGNWRSSRRQPLPYYPHSQVPKEMTRADMDATIADYVQAAHRAERAGFDMIELHAAHGYLIASFISPLTNKRTDEYGGRLQNRLRFPLEVFQALRKAWPDEKPMSVRISATDWQTAASPRHAVEVARAFAEAGCDLIDVSTGQTTRTPEPIRPDVPDAFSAQIRNDAGIATCASAPSPAPIRSTHRRPPEGRPRSRWAPHLADPRHR